MKGKIFLYIILAVIVGSIAFIAVDGQRGGAGNGASAKPTDEVILYWGEGCPHCEKVEEYLTSHKEIEEKIKIKIERKEVYKNQSNSLDLTNKAKSCKLETKKGVGIPFLYFRGECIEGDQPIIDYLNSKAK